MTNKKFTKEFINGRLYELGWEIPKGLKYNGMGNKKTQLSCIHCNGTVSRYLRNVFYRNECCLCTENQEKNMISKDKHNIKNKNQVKHNCIVNTVETDTISKQNCVDAHTNLSNREAKFFSIQLEYMDKMNKTLDVLLTLLNQKTTGLLVTDDSKPNKKTKKTKKDEDLENLTPEERAKLKFQKAFRPLISKIGFSKFQSRMSPAQWSKVSHEAAELFLEEFYKKSGLDLVDHYLVEKDMTKTQGDKILSNIIPFEYLEDAIEQVVVLRMKQ